MTEGIVLKDQAARDAAASAADYEHGWSADIDTEFAPKGLNEDTVRFISAKKNEPAWMLDLRLKAFRHWQTMPMPDWAKLNIAPTPAAPTCATTTSSSRTPPRPCPG